MIVGLLLAAGASKRFGAQKLIQDVDGNPVLRHAALSLTATAEKTVVVVAPGTAALEASLAGLEVQFVYNYQAFNGMGSSLACGVDFLDEAYDDVEGVLVALGDEPLLPRRSHERIVERFRAGGAEIVAGTYGGTRGHPVLFSRRVFPELKMLTGDRGARAVVDKDPSRVAFVEMGEAHPIDVDTPDDLARVKGSIQVLASPAAGPGPKTHNPRPK